MTAGSTAAWRRLRALLPGRADLADLRRHPRRDLLAGVTVAIVALPLALGFGVSSGLGAEAGLVTAVVAGALAAAFGGSHVQVSGPTGAMTVVLVPIAAAHGASGVLTVGLIAGLVLVGLAIARTGRYLRYIPASVVEGFTLGIACVIGLQQLPNALGVDGLDSDHVLTLTRDAINRFLDHPQWIPVGIAIAVAAVMLVGARWKPEVPFSILTVIAATVVVELAGWDAVATIGALPAGLPAPSLGFVELSAIPTLLGSAVAVAALAALESLLSASVADGMTVGRRHDPDRELFGQGLANIAAPLFGGVPATGAIARTAVNVRAGATSRLAAFTHAAVLAAVVYVAAPLVEGIPLAALAGVLLATAIRMVEVGALHAMVRATRSDAVVLVATAVVTVVVDLVFAVLVGSVVAAVLALRSIARHARLDQVDITDDLPRDTSDEEHALLAEHIVAYRIDGPLFFAAAHRFLLELPGITPVSVLILRMSRVTAIDASGVLALKDTIDTLERRGIAVYVSGIRDGHHRPLEALGVMTRLATQGRVFATTGDAIAAARADLRRDGHLAETASEEPEVESGSGEAATSP